MMESKTKILFALQQLENISNLVRGNEYERFMVQHIIPIKVELERQYSNLTQ
jgi:hypothetical protein